MGGSLGVSCPRPAPRLVPRSLIHEFFLTDPNLLSDYAEAPRAYHTEANARKSRGARAEVVAPASVS